MTQTIEGDSSLEGLTPKEVMEAVKWARENLPPGSLKRIFQKDPGLLFHILANAQEVGCSDLELKKIEEILRF